MSHPWGAAPGQPAGGPSEPFAPGAPTPPPYGPGQPGPYAQPAPPRGPYAPGGPTGPGPYATGPGWRQPQWHRPGIIPLARLSLADVFNGGVQIYRHNPKPALLLPLIVYLIVFAVGAPLVYLGGNKLVQIEAADSTEILIGFAQLLIPMMLPSLATMLLLPLTVTMALGAVLGERPSISEIWRAARGRIPAIVGLTLLLGLLQSMITAILVLPFAGGVYALGFDDWLGASIVLIVLGVIALFVLLAYVNTRLLLAPVALIAEQASIMGALRRSLQLTRGGFWWVFGLNFLSGMVVGLVSQVISTIASIIGAVGMLSVGEERGGGLVYVASSLSTSLAAALTMTFSTTVTTLLYVGRRIVTEAYDVELIQRASARR